MSLAKQRKPAGHALAPHSASVRSPVMAVESATELASEGGVQLFRPSKQRRTADARQPALEHGRAVAREGPPGSAEQPPYDEAELEEAEQAQDVAGEDAPGSAEQALSEETAPEEAEQGFRSLGISEWLDRTCSSLGIAAATAVQRSCIPQILQVRQCVQAPRWVGSLTRSTAGEECHSNLVHRQRQDGHLCAADPAAAGGQPVRRVCPCAHAHEVRVIGSGSICANYQL